MQPRQTVLEQFSTFANLVEARFQGWITDPRLRKSMAKQLSLAPDAPDSAVFWALYWHQCWQEKSSLKTQKKLAEWHLIAYLQETCYWVSQEILRKVVGLQSQASVSYTTTDYFQMAVAEIPRALQKFAPEQSTYLKAFSQVFLSNRIKSILRQRGYADFCSTWGLLKKTSRKALLEVLKYQGFGPSETEQYRLLWMGFKELYDALPPKARKRFEPDASFFQRIAEFYNRQRLSQLSQPAPSITPTEVEAQLGKLAGWIRIYHYPPTQSSNIPTSEEGDGDELQERLSDDDSRSLLEPLIEREEQNKRQEAQSKLQQRLFLAFKNLKPQSQQILCLFYAQGLTQQEVMKQIGVSQPTISRRLKKAKAQLLEAILHEAGPEVNNVPDPEQLKAITTALDEWLQVYLQESDLCE